MMAFFFFLGFFPYCIWQHIHACFLSPSIGRVFSGLAAESPIVLQAADKDDSVFEAEFKASSV